MNLAWRSVLLVAVIVLGLITVARSQQQQLTASKATLTLSRNIGVLVGTKPLNVAFHWSGSTQNLEAFFVVYQSTASRSQLQQAIDLGPSGSPLALSRPRSLASLGAHHDYHLNSRIFSDLGCGVTCAGVYPTELRLANSQTGATVAQIIVGIPFFPSNQAISAPLNVAPILQVDPAGDPGKLETALSQLSSSPAAATISLVGVPGVSLTRQRAYARLIGPSSLHQRATSIYAPIQASCMNSAYASTIGFDARLQLSRQINQSSQSSVFLSQAPSGTEFADLVHQHVGTVVVPDSVLSQLASVLSVSDPAYVRAWGLTILGVSSELSREFAGATTPIGYQRLVADLSQFYFQAPAQSGRVAMMSLDLSSPVQIDHATSVLNDLRQTPLFSLVTASDAATLPSAQLRESDVSLTATTRHCSLVSKALRPRLRDLSALVSADVGSRASLIPLIGLAQLATSGRSRVTSTERQAASLLGDQERQFLSQIQLVGSKTITLTSHSVSVPLTLSSKLPFPISVQLAIRSSEISFPKGARRSVKLTRGTATVALPVVVKALGTFAATAQVSAPNGSVLLLRTLTVHSTGFSTVGIVLTIGAALVLLTWWVRTARRHHKKTST